MRFPEDGPAGGANARTSGLAEPWGSASGERRAEARTSPLSSSIEAIWPPIPRRAVGWRSASADALRTGPAPAWRRLNWRLILALLLNGLAWWGVLALLTGP